MIDHITNELISFIKKSPSCFHVIHNIKDILKPLGFKELKESQLWNIEKGGKYYVTRNGSSVIAFQVGHDIDDYGFQITASHSDSPTFKLKEHSQLAVQGAYVKLNTEGYGGMIMSSWMDRPLSLAGRVLVKSETGMDIRLVDINRDLLLIPNVAIHMNREINSGYKFNPQIDMLPLLGEGTLEDDYINHLIAEQLGVSVDAIMSSDLYIYNRMDASIWGANEEFVSSPKLDDLQCAYTTLQGFLQASPTKSVNVYACFDNEEVGSATKQGAGSTFLYDTLQRIHQDLEQGNRTYYQAIANSFMISADNAHALHPNHPEKTDANNFVRMNGGIVIKQNANQKYTSDAISIALFKDLCDQAQAAVQFFSNRSDMAGGSTLGNISNTNVSLHTVDIGLAQLAMHSSYETAGCIDSATMVKAITTFYSHALRESDTGYTWL